MILLKNDLFRTQIDRQKDYHLQIEIIIYKLIFRWNWNWYTTVRTTTIALFAGVYVKTMPAALLDSKILDLHELKFTWVEGFRISYYNSNKSYFIRKQIKTFHFAVISLHMISIWAALIQTTMQTQYHESPLVNE